MTRTHQALLLLLFAPVAGCDLFQSPLVKACQEVLKERLVNPSSYRQIDFAETTKPISVEEYQANAHESPIVMQAMADMGKKPMRAIALISYDAKNSFGATVRGTVECSYDALGKDALKDASKWSVRVDGKTHTEYLGEAIRRATSGR